MPTVDLSRVAVSRYGYGPRAGEAFPSDPVRWLRQQIDAPPPLPTGITVNAAIAARLQDVQDRETGVIALDDGFPRHQAIFNAERDAWAARRLVSTASFYERLVDFWFNHFTVAQVTPQTMITVGCYLREAIYPRIMGRFSDMLLAVVRHPAMLWYLNNDRSTGRNSFLGARNNLAPNENLAREVLELHSITPAAGYTQNDVTQFSRILTGWNVNTDVSPYGFVFDTLRHEPGTKTMMGITYQAGEQGGINAINWLGTHRSTYTNIADKLCRHFLGDSPPADVVTVVRNSLGQSGGNLRSAYIAMITHPLALQGGTMVKFRSPIDYVLAANRAFGSTDHAMVLSGISYLNQPLFEAPQPNGWSDTLAGWTDPEAMMRRQDWVYRLAASFNTTVLPADFLKVALGSHAETDTITAAASTTTTFRQAATQREALTLIMSSPEFNFR